uniref:Sushi domain-containing protein n=1 Tax=Labrus bergylta TaxID=56723 RepID=A0A3Q3ECM4_9LABR
MMIINAILIYQRLTSLSLVLEVRCSNQRDLRVYSWNVRWGQIITLDESVSYRCKTGYRAASSSARCTRDGWSPNPLCQAVSNPCKPPPKIENAVIVKSYQKQYLSDSEVTYQCRDKYTMEGEGTVRCFHGQWEFKNISCRRKYIQNERISRKSTYKFKTDKVTDILVQKCMRGIKNPIKGGSNHLRVSGQDTIFDAKV